MFRLVVLLAVVVSAGCVTRTRYDALAAEREQAQQALLAERDAGQVQAARCTQELADAAAQVTGCEARGDELKREIERQAAAARANELEAQDLRSDLKTQQELLARLVKDRSQLKGTVDEMRGALAAAADREREAARRVAEFKDMLARFKDLIDAGKLQVRLVDGRMVLTLPMDILFPSGSAKLAREGREALLAVGRGLATIPERRFQVEGHTDDVPIHTAAYPSNWELAAARALGVVNALLEGGMAPQRLSAASFSEYRPTAPNDGDSNRGRNRRIEIVVVPDLRGLPGFRELQQLAGGN